MFSEVSRPREDKNCVIPLKQSDSETQSRRVVARAGRGGNGQLQSMAVSVTYIQGIGSRVFSCSVMLVTQC